MTPRRVWGRVTFFAIAVIVGHHVGTVFKGLGSLGDADWADWIDVLVPYLVLGAAALVLRAVGVDRATWLLYWIGAILYTQGHGIHLAANSIGNDGPITPRVHLWDEVVGHYLWYAGWLVVVASLARALMSRERARGYLWYAVAALYGLTWMTNTVEGGTAILGLAGAAVFAVWGFMNRDRAGIHLFVAYGVALVLLVAFGIWQGGFPQFSELGWI
jgi:hypothetical protein